MRLTGRWRSKRWAAAQMKRSAALTAALLAAMAAGSLPDAGRTTPPPKARAGSTGNAGLQQVWRTYPLRQPSQPASGQPKTSTGEAQPNPGQPKASAGGAPSNVEQSPGAPSNVERSSRLGQSGIWLWLLSVAALSLSLAAVVATVRRTAPAGAPAGRSLAAPRVVAGKALRSVGAVVQSTPPKLARGTTSGRSAALAAGRRARLLLPYVVGALLCVLVAWLVAQLP